MVCEIEHDIIARVIVERPRYLAEADCWCILGLRDAQTFFQAVSELLPDATHVYLEGSPSSAIVDVIQPHTEDREYGPPAGTIWSWPREHRWSLKASPALFARLAEAAARHAAPEICTHLSLYRDADALAQWFDAFSDPFLVSKEIPRERAERFCLATGGTLQDEAARSSSGGLRDWWRRSSR